MTELKIEQLPVLVARFGSQVVYYCNRLKEPYNLQCGACRAELSKLDLGDICPLCGAVRIM